MKIRLRSSKLVDLLREKTLIDQRYTSLTMKVIMFVVAQMYFFYFN